MALDPDLIDHRFTWICFWHSFGIPLYLLWPVITVCATCSMCIQHSAGRCWRVDTLVLFGVLIGVWLGTIAEGVRRGTRTDAPTTRRARGRGPPPRCAVAPAASRR